MHSIYIGQVFDIGGKTIFGMGVGMYFFWGVGGGEFRCYYLTILERLRDSGLYM